MNTRLILSMLPFVAFVLPVPASGSAFEISCLGTMIASGVPGTPDSPTSDKGCCKGACHLGQDRRKKADKPFGNCC